MAVLNNSTSGTLIAGTADADSIVNYGDRVTIEAGDGDDTIHNKPPDTAVMGETITGSNVIINGAEGNDSVRNESSSVTINAADGDDTVENSGANGVIDAGADADYVYNSGSGASINAGAGNDTVQNYSEYVTIDGDDGADSIRNYAWNVTVNAGSGNDTLYNSGDYSTINAGAGDDTVYNSGDYSTINAGDGNDLVSLGSGSSRLIQYSSGNDTVLGFKVGDTLQLLNGSLTDSLLEDNDIVLHVGNGSIRLREVFGSVNSRVTLPSVEERGTFVVNNVNILDGLQEYYDASLSSAAEADDIVVGAIQTDAAGVKYIPKAGVGKQVIYAPSNWYVAGTDYDDSLVSTGEFITISPGKGNDTLVGSEFGEVYLVGANTGNNLITNLGVNDTLQLVNGTISAIETVDNDLVIRISSANNSGSVTLGNAGQYNMARDGDYFVIRNYDEYSNTLDSTLIATSDRADSIVNSGANVTIQSAGADDTVDNSGASAVIETGADDDVVVNDGVDVTIRAGLGDDSINNSSLGSNAVIDGGTGIDTIVNAGAGVSLTTGEGNDYVNNTAENVTISAGAGSDNITNSGAGVRIGAGEGTLGYVYNTGENTTIDADDGILGYVNNRGSNVTINGGAGNDQVINYGALASIDGGEGNDAISNYSSSDVTINGGAGNDNISNRYSSDVTIDGGDGNDSISNSYSSSRVSINAGDGNDYIDNNSSNVTVAGGAGNDTVNSASVYQYSAGNDVITNYSAGETIQLLNGSVDSSSIEGTDVILYVGDGSVRLIGKKTTRITVLDSEGNLTTKYYGVVTINNTVDNTLITAEPNDYLIDNSGSSVTINADTGNDTINNTGANAVIGTGDGNNRVENSGAGSTITGGADSDIVNNTAASVTIDGGAGSDYVTNSGSSVILNGGANVDYINNSGSYVTIDAGDDDDRVYNYDASNVSINGGAGNDEIENEYGYDVTIDAGDGDDHVYNYDASNVSINGGAGNDEIENEYGYDVTIDAGDGDDRVYNYDASNVSINGGAGNDTIENYNSSNVTLNGGDGNDYIENESSSVTIAGGAGNDTLNRADRYQYSAGNDLITDYAVGDTIELLDQTLNGVSIDGSNMIFNVNGGTLTVLDGRFKRITLLDGNGSLTSQYFGAENVANAADNTLIHIADDNDHVVDNEGENVTIESGGGNDYIVNSGANASINVGAGADIINNTGANATIDLGAGEDSIFNSSVASYAVIDAGDDNDTVTNYGAYSTVRGGAGEDYIANNSNASYAVLDGGEGADTVTNYGAYSTVRGGDGDDHIDNYAANSTIEGGAGDDYVHNEGARVEVDMGEGTNTIRNGTTSDIDTGAYSILRSGSGNDSIENFSTYTTIDAGDGDNLIDNSYYNYYYYSYYDYGAYSSLRSGAGADTISNHGSHTTIDSGAGNDSIISGVGYYTDDNYGSASSLNAGAGDDTVTNYGSQTTVDGGAGADLIENGRNSSGDYNHANNAVLNGGAGADTILNHSDGVTIDAGADDDVISLGADAESNVIIYSGGDDTIHGFYSDTDSLQVASGITFINSIRSGYDMILDAGADGTLTVLDALTSVQAANASFNLDDAGTLTGVIVVNGHYVDDPDNTYGASFKTGAGWQDVIVGSVTADHVYEAEEGANLQVIAVPDLWTVRGTSTDDIINATGSLTAIEAGDGNDRINNSGDYALINAGEGDNFINNYGTGSLAGGEGNGVTINAGDGNDTVRNRYVVASGSSLGYAGGDSVIVNTGEGNNYVENSGNDVTINAGSSADTIDNNGDRIIINAGAGNDSITSGCESVTINGAEGADTVLNQGSLTAINAGDGNDVIINDGIDVTINGGTGNDEIIMREGSALVEYADGDGHDTVFGYHSDTTTIQIASGLSTSSIASGDDILISIVGASTGSILLRESYEGLMTIGAVNANVNLADAGSSIGYFVVDGLLVDDTSAFYDASFAETAGLTFIKVGTVGSAHDYVAGNMSQKITVASDWNVTATNQNDTIDVIGSNASVKGGGGADVISLGAGAAILNYADGDGNDTVYGYSSDTTTLQFAAGISTATVRNGDDIIITANGTATGSVTLIDAGIIDSLNVNVDLTAANGATGYFVVDASTLGDLSATYDATLASSTVAGDFVAGSVDAVYNYVAASNTSQNITVDNNWTVTATDNADSIDVIGSNASVKGGGGADVISLGAGAAILNYEDGDGNDTVYGYSSDTTTLQFAAGISTATVRNGDDIIITANGTATGSVTLIDAGIIDSLNVNVDLTAANGATGYFVVDASTLGDLSATYDASLASSTVAGDFVAGSVDAAYNYVAASNTSQNITVDSNWTVTATDNADSIDVIGSNASVDGGAGDDSISNNGSTVTLNGGGGSDAISLGSGSGAAIVNYSSGDGDDFVYGYAADDATLRFDMSSPTLTSVASGSNVVINVNGSSGSITLVDFSGAVNAVDANGDTLSIAGASTTTTVTPTYVNPNANINLANATDSVGYFVVNSPTSSVSFYNASFTGSAGSYDVIVGNVSGGSIYAATSNALRQNITVTSDWNVTATQYNDSLSVEGDNATLTTGNGNDTVNLASGVSMLTFTDLSGSDRLSFETSIAERSLHSIASDDGITLYSNDLMLVFEGASLDQIRNYTVNNAGTTNIIEDLIIRYVTPNALIDLTDVDTVGVFVVDGTASYDSNTFNAATLTSTVGADDTIVGEVESSFVYRAADDAGRQAITVDAGWNVTASALDDLIDVLGDGANVDAGAGNDEINVEGNNATITGGAGADDIVVSSAVATLTLTDLSSDDRLSFSQYITPNSLYILESAAGVVLYSEQINLAFNQPLADILALSVDNAGTSYTIEDLIYTPSSISGANAFIDLAEATTTGWFEIDASLDVDSDTFYTASFTTVASDFGNIVGNVSSDHVYSARNDAGRQAIIVTDDWNVTATALDDEIKLLGNNSTITSGDGEDSIFVTSGVSNVAFTDLSAADLISFDDAVSLNSLFTLPSDAGAVLYSDQINLAFNNPLSDLLTFSLDNAGTVNTFAELIYNAPTAFNSFVDLSNASTVGSYVVNGRLVEDSDTFYDAAFVGTVGGYDVAVGDVLSDHVYSARSLGRQHITADGDWNVTATDLNDRIDVTGDGATISSGNGADSINVSSSAVTFTDLSAADLISFSQAIAEHSLFTLESAGGSVLYSDQISLAFNNPLDELLTFSVDNAGTVNTFADLVRSETAVVNANIDLNSSAFDGYFVVDSREVTDPDAFYNATLTSSSITAYDVAVGSVNAHNYVATKPGRQSITVGDNNWNITTGDDADSILVGSGVTAITFNNFDGTDNISFERAIEENSLITLESGGNSTLYSDQISLSFINSSVADLMSTSFDDLIYTAPTVVNSFVELTSAATDGAYVVNGRTATDGTTFYNAAFTNSSITLYDVAVGDVNNHVYSARDLGRQRLIVGADNWSITTADGADSITIASGVTSITFSDLDAADVISFDDAISVNSLFTLESGGNSTLYSDQINLAFNNRSVADLLNTPFAALIYDAPSTVNANVELSDVSTVGAYVVNGREAIAGDTFYDAAFVETVGGYDVAVGDVSSDHVYSARSIGQQSITVGADNWSITTGEGEDSILVGASVKAITFNELDGDDAITFEQPIDENSLFIDTIEGGTVLYSDQISITFADQSLDDLINSDFAELIYNAPSTVNANVELAAVSTVGAYVVNGREAIAGDTFYDAAFVETVGGYDVAVGDVSSDHVYSARSIGQQSITVSADNWSITTADGEDSILVGASVKAITFNELDAADNISFEQPIDANSLFIDTIEGGTVLYSDQISITFADQSLDDLRSSSFADLIYDAPSTVNANVELAAVSTVGAYVINGREAIAGDTFYDAAFVETVGGYDVAVGDVSSDHVYSARNLGSQSITVSADNWSITTGDGADSIFVGAGVSSITFSVLDANDAITFERAIDANSLLNRTIDGGTVLYSDRIGITFGDQSLADLRSSSFADLIYDAPSIVNANIELSSDSADGAYVVNGRLIDDPDAFYDATLTSAGISLYDVSVGSVNDRHYVAGDLGRQSITVSADNWNITTGEGADSILVGSAVTSITFGDLDSADAITFENPLETNSLLTLESGGNSTLYSDRISLAFNNRSVDELLTTPFAEFLYNAPSTVNSFVELGGSSIGAYVVNGREAIDSDTFYDAAFVETVGGYDVAVGDVSSDHVYSARNVGHQSITVGADNWSITTGEGADSILVGSAVTSIAFNVLDADDAITFERAIDANSLLNRTIDGGTVLYSDRIGITFGDQSLDDLQSSAFAEYIYSAPSIVNANVDLTTATLDGSYVVNGRIATNANAFYNATLASSNITLYDVTVGSVNVDERVYSARNIGRQSITAGEGWNITATGRDDVINIEGNGATIASGNGADRINVGAGVSTLTLTDLSATDSLAFAQRIDPNSLYTLASDGGVVLYSDSMSIAFGQALDAILNYTVDNAGTSNTIDELIYRPLVEPDSYVDLTSVPDGATGWFVVDRADRLADDQPYYFARFAVETDAGVIVVGTVEDNAYTASEDSGRQYINVGAEWPVTALERDDFINIAGDGSTIVSGNGDDSINVSSAVTTLTLDDLSASDLLSFEREIAPRSMHTSTVDDSINFASDQINLTFNNRSLSVLQRYTFDDAGYETSIYQLIDNPIGVNLHANDSVGTYTVERTSTRANASLVASPADGDIIAGTVESARVYVADPSSPRQSITISGGWLVTGTNVDDTLVVRGNGATVDAADGSDVISIGAAVSTISFNNLADDDLISFSEAIPLNSLVISEDGYVLSSDQITLAFNQSVDELLDVTVDNAGTSNSIAELIATGTVPSDQIPNAIVDLASAAGNGVYVINASALNGSDTLYAAAFTQSTVEGDIVVGTVEGGNYSARSNFNRQAIGINAAWNVTAAELDDFLYVTGNGATITAGEGSDSIVVDAGVSSITFNDLSSSDVISFMQSIAEHSLFTLESGGSIILHSDQISLAFNNRSLNEILNYTVNNGGTSNTIADLVVHDTVPSAAVDLSTAGSDGVFVVDGRSATEPNTFYAATFTNEPASTDIVVGSVAGGNYVARAEAERQSITVNDNRQVTATALDDVINVTGNGSTVYSGAGNDTVALADNVVNVVFADHDSADLIALNRSIVEHSLNSLQGADGTTLASASEQLTLVFNGRNVDELLNYAVDNGGDPLTLEDLIFSPIEAPKAVVDLTATDASGVYVVDGRIVSDLDAYYAATFTHSTLETDYVVGNIDGDRQYSARSDANGQQITAYDYWRVTSTKYGDLIRAEGSDVTINTGKGNDTIVIGDGATTITFGDLDTAHDSLSFYNAIDAQSMSSLEADGNVTLQSAAMMLTFEDKTWAEMRRYVVDNGGVDMRLEELIKPTIHKMDLATWNYEYEAGMARSAAIDNGAMTLASGNR